VECTRRRRRCKRGGASSLTNVCHCLLEQTLEVVGGAMVGREGGKCENLGLPAVRRRQRAKESFQSRSAAPHATPRRSKEGLWGGLYRGCRLPLRDGAPPPAIHGQPCRAEECASAEEHECRESGPSHHSRLACLLFEQACHPVLPRSEPLPHSAKLRSLCVLFTFAIFVPFAFNSLARSRRLTSACTLPRRR
jgi:hypothetical protein